MMQRAGRTLAMLLVGASLLLPYVGGFPAAYLMMALTLLLAGRLVVTRQKLDLGIADWCLLGSVAVLAVVFLLNGTAAYIVNFAMLALAVPLTAALRANGSSDHVQVVARLALAGVAIAAAVALYQVVIEHKVRAAGYGSDEIWSAVAALVIGWLALMGQPGAKGVWRYLYLLGPVLACLVLLLSGSRGPMLVVPVLFGVAFAMLPGHRLKVLAVMLVVAALVYKWPDQSRLHSITAIGKGLVTGGPPADGSYDVREVLLDASLAAFQISPWTGYGWSKFAEATSQFTGQDSWVNRADAFHLHSDLLNFAVAGGVAGLVAYGLILLAPLAGAWRSAGDAAGQPVRAGAVLLVAAYAGCGLTNTFFGFEMHTALFACLYAILFGYCRDRPKGVAS
jgi:O-antigen ligase